MLLATDFRKITRNIQVQINKYRSVGNGQMQHDIIKSIKWVMSRVRITEEYV